MVEVYRVTRRVELGIKATAVCSEKLQQLLKDISRVWNNLMGFMSLAKLAVRYSKICKSARAQGGYIAQKKKNAQIYLCTQLPLLPSITAQTCLHSSSADTQVHMVIEQ